MASEFLSVWENVNSPEYELNAANLGAISPHLLYLGKQYLHPVTGARDTLLLSGDTVFKVVDSGVHRLFRVNTDIQFKPVDLLDTGSSLTPGTDYHVYIVTNSGTTANLVVSKNSTYPDGATAENSRRIGGFHTLCADIGALQTGTHSLYGFMARDILPQSCWDLLNRPSTCEPQGMVLDPKTKTWIDIYLQSGTGENTKSVYQGTVTNTRSWDQHQEDLFAVGKRMLHDNEFTSATWGTIPYRNVMGSVNPVTTGGKVNTDGMRIVSNIGCEDMAGCFWQWIGQDTFTGYSDSGAWKDANPTDQGKHYSNINAVFAGGAWVDASYAGARCRYANAARSSAGGNRGSRGCSDGLCVL